MKIITFLVIFFTISLIASAQNVVEKPDSSRDLNIDMPEISISSADFESNEETQDVYSLLQASRDIFINTAGYTLGAARFRIRGYDSENTNVFLNGIQMNDVETGRVFWSIWGGLNDATRNKQYVNGLNNMHFDFGAIGGGAFINTRASKQRAGTKVNYAVSNRSYTNRIMFTHSTGELKNGWAFTFSGSRRWGQEGYKEGTFYDAWAYFGSIEKKINSKHSISLTGFEAPSERGKAGGSTQEAYDLLDNNQYNPYWGYQNGEKRNSRFAISNKPYIILNEYYKLNDKTTITTSLGYTFGKYGSTALDWYNTMDPRPDYYRYLPSYVNDPTLENQVAQAFIDNSQLNWDNFYRVNNASYDENGLKRSKYIIEERRTDYQQEIGNITINNKLNDQISIDGGINFSLYKARHHKIINDLLGGDYYVDIDKFAERDNPANEDFYQNDLNNPNRIVKVGDSFGYDYDLNQNKSSAWLQSTFKYSKFDFFLAGNASYTSFWRTGHMKNGKFPEDSYGDSKKQNFLNYGTKGGITYKLNGRNYLYAQGAYLTRAPYMKNAYISPRTRDFVVNNLKNETIYSGEIGYNLRAPRVTARLTAYYTKFKDQTRVRSFYNDLYHNFTNHILTGIEKQNTGIEFGSEIKITSTISTTLVAAVGQNIYTNRPTAVIIQDNDATQIAEPKTVFQKYYFQANGPQKAYSFGLSYRSPKYWFININANYFDNIYLDFNPERRTIDALANTDGSNAVVEGSQLWNDIIDQEKLKPAFTLDLFGGKSWRINHDTPSEEGFIGRIKSNSYFIYLNIGINNILNNTDFITGGYEQLRYDYTNRNVDKFPPKYFYAYGRNYFIMLGLRF